MLKKVFAVNGKQLNPYAPENFPKSFDGAEAIYKQNSGLTTNFGAMRFPQADFCHGRSEFLFRKI
jgi:hypothetical protein